MLEGREQLKPVFWNFEADREKKVDCVKVDGASDEGPSLFLFNNNTNLA